MRTHEYVLAEVRRISAGGDPRRVHRKNIFVCSAARLGWKATPEVLRLLAKVEGKQ